MSSFLCTTVLKEPAFTKDYKLTEYRIAKLNKANQLLTTEIIIQNPFLCHLKEWLTSLQFPKIPPRLRIGKNNSWSTVSLFAAGAGASGDAPISSSTAGTLPLTPASTAVGTDKEKPIELISHYYTTILKEITQKKDELLQIHLDHRTFIMESPDIKEVHASK